VAGPGVRRAGGGHVDSLTREDAVALDADDPLAPFRARFVNADPERIYLDGNSLGRLPLATRDRVAALVGEWGERLVSGWPDWIDAPARVGDLIAAHVLGARPGEAIVSDSTTVNLFKLCSAVLDQREGAIVTDRGNFPTDRYVLEGLAARHGRELRLVATPQDAVAEAGAALVVLSHVAYRSGELADLAELTAATRADVVWDLSHSAGAVPIDVRAARVELAVGCTYKYLNGGPGAPAFLYVAEERQAALRSPIWGWFGQADQFEMERDYDPREGIGRFLAGTPPILDLAAVEEGVLLTGEAGVPAIRAKSIALCELIVALHDAWLAPLGFSLGSPREPERRGSHVALRHAEAWPICRALIERANVVPDFRGPDVIRLGVAPLYTGYADVWDALDRLRALVERGEHRLVDAARGRVT
jgi:kynureninase